MTGSSAQRVVTYKKPDWQPLRHQKIRCTETDGNQERSGYGPCQSILRSSMFIALETVKEPNACSASPEAMRHALSADAFRSHSGVMAE